MSMGDSFQGKTGMMPIGFEVFFSQLFVFFFFGIVQFKRVGGFLVSIRGSGVSMFIEKQRPDLGILLLKS